MNLNNKYIMLDELKNYFEFTPEELKSETILKKKQNVYFLILNTKANAFTKSFTRSINSQLDIVEANQGPTSMVTVSSGKLFSGGLDLQYISSLNKDDVYYFVLQVIKLFGRLKILPFPTYALVRGAAIAGGCMLSFCHDYIYAYDNSSFRCNEAEMGLPLPPGMNAVIKSKFSSPQHLRDMIVISKKFTALEGHQVGFIDVIIKQKGLEKVFNQANEKSQYGQNKVNTKKLKQELYKQVTDCCFNKQHAVGVRAQTNLKLGNL